MISLQPREGALVIPSGRLPPSGSRVGTTDRVRGWSDAIANP
jgi:hypothetical protein